MLMENNLEKVITHLLHHDDVQIEVNGVEITVHVVDDASKIFLSSLIYKGDGYIPLSVRDCLKKEAPFTSNRLNIYPALHEKKFSVTLHFMGSVEYSPDSVGDLLNEFAFVANEWRAFLDEHDKNDLVHARHKL